MKKKILTLCLVVALAATAIVGGTLAYFSDTDAAKNVMTTGNVKIVQNEQERGANGALVEFQDNHKLAPYTGKIWEGGMASEWGASFSIGGTEYNMFDTSKNAIDKIVTVTNNGTEACYVRTLFAFEMIPVKDDSGNITGWINPLKDGSCGTGKYIYATCANGAGGKSLRSWTYDADNEFGLNVKQGEPVTFEMDGVRYVVMEHIYNGILSAKATTAPSLRNFYLNANAGNEWYDLVGGEYNILVLSQATQVQGFAADPATFDYAEAKTALNTAFGGVDEFYKISAETYATWFAECR